MYVNWFDNKPCHERQLPKHTTHEMNVGTAKEQKQIDYKTFHISANLAHNCAPSWMHHLFA